MKSAFPVERQRVDVQLRQLKKWVKNLLAKYPDMDGNPQLIITDFLNVHPFSSKQQKKLCDMLHAGEIAGHVVVKRKAMRRESTSQDPAQVSLLRPCNLSINRAHHYINGWFNISLILL